MLPPFNATHLGLVYGLEATGVSPQVQDLVHVAHLHSPGGGQITGDLLLLGLNQLDSLFAGDGERDRHIIRGHSGIYRLCMYAAPLLVVQVLGHRVGAHIVRVQGIDDLLVAQHSTMGLFCRFDLANE